ARSNAVANISCAPGWRLTARRAYPATVATIRTIQSATRRSARKNRRRLERGPELQRAAVALARAAADLIRSPPGSVRRHARADCCFQAGGRYAGSPTRA